MERSAVGKPQELYTKWDHFAAFAKRLLDVTAEEAPEKQSEREVTRSHRKMTKRQRCG